MKKRTWKLFPMLILALALVLAACNTADPAESAAPGGPAESAAPVASGDIPDAATLISRIEEASADIRSMRAELRLEQQMDMKQEETETTLESGGPVGIPASFDMVTDMEMEMMTEPLKAFMKMTFGSPDDADDTLEMQAYVTEDGMYMNQGDQWVHMTGGEFDFDPEEIKESYMSEDTMNALREIEDDLVITDEGDAYRIQYNGDGEAASELIRLQMTDPDVEGTEINFHSLDYSYLVGKDDYIPRAIDMDMGFELLTEIGTMIIQQHVVGEFFDVNQINDITIPQEALDAPSYP